MGIQQDSPYSVMVEVAGYRSPEANEVMNEIQAKALAFSTAGPKPLLHWGLENDQVTGANLSGTPLGQPYKGNFTRLTAFTEIRSYLKRGHPSVFDNNFSTRLGRSCSSTTRLAREETETAGGLAPQHQRMRGPRSTLGDPAVLTAGQNR
jgi:hypothetical protein